MNVDAVVVGAGAAGLAAARTLAGSSLRVALVEARHRDGGRVLSVPSGRSMVPAELGAEFIHGPAEETRAALRAAGAAAIQTGGDAWTFDGAELQRADDDFVSAAGIFERALSLGNDETVERFLQRCADEGAARASVANARAFVEGFDAADPTVASARAIAEEWASGVDFANARPLGGYPSLFARLREECAAAGVTTLLSSAVRRIAWERGAVTVGAAGGARNGLALRARAAVVTVPAAVLRARDGDGVITFEPELPPAKRTALASIETGDVVKVALMFRTAFWERIGDGRFRDAAFFRAAGQTFPTYWTQAPVESELMIAWAGGPKATALRDVPERELIVRALDGLGTLFGDARLVRDECVDARVHDWAADPFARGAYSYIRAGGGDARRALAEPVGDTLFFAGEATAEHGQAGTVNGALVSGERAAREAAAALRAVTADG